ncbi:hypothetical protein MRX96_039084 [Rhipicephalus microplus]
MSVSIKKEVQFLGHKIDATGLHPLRDNLDRSRNSCSKASIDLRLSRVENHQLICCWDSSPGHGCPPTFQQGQCLQSSRLPENDLCRSQRHPFSHPESPSGPANFNKGRNGFQGQ